MLKNDRENKRERERRRRRSLVFHLNFGHRSETSSFRDSIRSYKFIRYYYYIIIIIIIFALCDERKTKKENAKTKAKLNEVKRKKMISYSRISFTKETTKKKKKETNLRLVRKIAKMQKR